MAEGRLIVHAQCRLCGYVGPIPREDLAVRYGDFLAADLKPALRCMNCGARGEVEVRLGWAGPPPNQKPGL